MDTQDDVLLVAYQHGYSNARQVGEAQLAEAQKVIEGLRAALTQERRVRLLGQEPNVHWESMRDLRRACYAATDAALAQDGGQQGVESLRQATEDADRDDPWCHDSDMGAR